MSSNKNKCSLCGSLGTRMTNCPLNNKAKNPDPKKHPNAVKILQEMSKRSQKPVKKTTAIKIKKSKQLYTNPYIHISQVSCQYTSAIINTLKKNRGVVITGAVLKNLNFNINRPQSVKINIPHSIHNRDKLIEFVQLICDMVTQLGQYTVDKKDYFSKPNKEVLKLLQLVEGLKTEFIKFLLTFITRDGGTPEYIDNFLQPIDNIIETINTMEELMGLDNVFALSQLPDVPNSLPKIGEKNSKKEKIAISLDN
jgi:hypothetical protein